MIANTSEITVRGITFRQIYGDYSSGAYLGPSPWNLRYERDWPSDKVYFTAHYYSRDILRGHGETPEEAVDRCLTAMEEVRDMLNRALAGVRP